MISFPGCPYTVQLLRPVSALSGRKEFIKNRPLKLQTFRRTQSFPRTRRRPECADSDINTLLDRCPRRRDGQITRHKVDVQPWSSLCDGEVAIWSFRALPFGQTRHFGTYRGYRLWI